MNKKLGIFVVLFGLFVLSLVFGGETESASVEKDDFSASLRGNGLDVYFFYGEGCPHCAKVKPLLAEMQQKYPLQLHKYDIYNNRSSLSLFDEYSSRYGLPMESRGVPTVFVSDSYFVGDGPILDGFEEVVKEALKRDSPVNSVLKMENLESPDREVTSVASSLSILTVTVAGLVDSISPCSIAILVFLVGARVLVANKKKRILKTGLAFCLSVFIAYFLFGLGLLTFVQVSGYSNIFSVLVGLFAVLVGIFYLKDVFWYGKGGFAMEVPSSLKPLLMKMLKGVTSPLGAFVMGFVVVCFELPCTGGPYLFILGQLADGATRLQAIPLLLYYNFLFVLPLIIVSLLLYSNLFSPGKLRQWNEKNKRLLKSVGGLTMIALGFLTIPTLPTLHSIQIFLLIFRVAGLPLLTIMLLYFVVSSAKPKHLGNGLRGTLLISILSTLVFIVPSPANLSEGAIQSGSCIIKVQYQDGCPRSGADVVYYSDYPNDPWVLGQTGEDGTISCDSLSYPSDYIVEAWYGVPQFGTYVALSIDETGYGRTTIEESFNYPNGTETCGDSECDGYQYCIIPEVGNPYIECNSWDTECDTKKCCQCDGGTIANPAENYDETQDEDCGPGYECSGLDTCSPSGCVTIKVEYDDGQPRGSNCPRSNADINTIDAPNPPYTRYICTTNETGECTRCGYLEPGDYVIQAWYGPFQFGPNTYLGVNENGDGSQTIKNTGTNYPNGTETCGDSECDGFQYCIIPEVDNPYIECDSWNTECDTKKCCNCSGGTEVNPTENYDENQDEDCGLGYECSGLDTCSLIHDVATTDVSPSKTGIGQGYLTSINITVENQGGSTETFNVTIFYNDTAITLPDGKNYTTVTLTGLNSTTIEVIWNTTDVAYGNYTIKAEASTVLGEKDTNDNTFINGQVYVGIPGDFDCDGYVGPSDFAAFAGAYGTSPPINPNCDFDNDNYVGPSDFAIFAGNYGRTNP